MPLMFLVMLATAHLENFDFVMTTVRNHGRLDGDPNHQRGADFHTFAFAYEKDLIECDFCANVCRYLFYFKFLTSGNTILFASGFYDRVHVGLQGTA